MRARIAAVLRRAADYLMPQPAVIEVRYGDVDGAELERKLVALKRRRGGRPLGFQ